MSQLDPPAPRRLKDRLPFDADALLTGEVRRFFAGTLVLAVGLGLILPLFVIFCVDVRHFSTFATGAILAWQSILGVTLGPLFGTLVDRLGPSRVLAVSMPLSAVGIAAIGVAPNFATMLVVSTAVAVVGAGDWSAFSTLMARLVGEERRADAFGVNFLLLNVGIGIGVAIGTSFVSTTSLRSFQVTYLLSAACSLVAAGVWFTLRSHGGAVAEVPRSAEHHDEHLDEHHNQAVAGRAEGWREVLKDRRMVRFVATSLVIMVCGYGSIEAGVPIFVKNVDHLSLHVVGLLFICNTLTIAIGQLFSLALIKGRSRSLVLASVGLCWGLSWFFVTASVYVSTIAAVVALCVGQVVFATGETLWQPVAPALVNDLAPEHLRGRYNAMLGIVWGASSAVGQLVATLMIQLHLAVAWTLLVALGAIVGGAGVATMRRVLTPAEDGRAVAEPAAAAAAASST